MNPQDDLAQAALGERALKLGDDAAAEERLRRAVALEEREAYHYHGLFRLWSAKSAKGGGERRQALLGQALAEMDKALELHPYNALLWFERGVFCLRDDRGEEALASFLRAVELEPNYVAARFNLAVSREKTGADPLADYRQLAELLDKDYDLSRENEYTRQVVRVQPGMRKIVAGKIKELERKK